MSVTAAVQVHTWSKSSDKQGRSDIADRFPSAEVIGTEHLTYAAELGAAEPELPDR